ncbi:cuticle protein 7 isoform X1 [Cherax quadricarinatus]
MTLNTSLYLLFSPSLPISNSCLQKRSSRERGVLKKRSAAPCPFPYIREALPQTLSHAPSLPYQQQRLEMFLLKVAALVVVLGSAVALPSDLYGAQPVYKDETIPYNYAYGVKDDYAGTDFGHNEDSDGNAVKGSYNVALPDGRIQTVNYVADHYNGYQAQVSYKGEAQYPHEYGPAVTFKPQQYQPSYQPQPSYQ